VPQTRAITEGREVLSIGVPRDHVVLPVERDLGQAMPQDRRALGVNTERALLRESERQGAL
jgi:hypothetical protein